MFAGGSKSLRHYALYAVQLAPCPVDGPDLDGLRPRSPVLDHEAFQRRYRRRRYRWDAMRPAGHHGVPASVRLEGKPLEPGKQYHIVANAFLAAGAQRFTVFK